MKYAFIFIVLFLLLVLQGGLVGNLGLGAVGNVLMLYLAVTVILGTYEEAFFIVLVGGLMLDLVSAHRIGSNIVSLFAVFGFTHIFITKFVPREPNRLILVICIAANTILFAATFVIFNRLLVYAHLDTGVDISYVLGRKLLLDLLANTVLTYPVLGLFELTKNFKKKYRKFA